MASLASDDDGDGDIASGAGSRASGRKAAALLPTSELARNNRQKSSVRHWGRGNSLDHPSDPDVCARRQETPDPAQWRCRAADFVCISSSISYYSCGP